MTDQELEEIRSSQKRRLEKARNASLDYAEGIQCMLDCSELLAEIDRLRAAGQSPSIP
jgi:hypothetical protein